MDEPLPVDPRASPERMRIDLLHIGDEAGWWSYQSANPPGYVDSAGRTYDRDTYTVLIPPPQGHEQPDGQADLSERVLLADEVKGYVLATADRYPRGVELIAYRTSLL